MTFASDPVVASGHSERTNKKKAVASPSEATLLEAFQTLTAKLGVQDLKLVWMPGSDGGLSGEVRNGFLYVYEADESKALETLKHELMDYLITSRVIKPLVDLINLLIKSRESDVYREKEKIVESLSRMLV